MVQQKKPRGIRNNNPGNIRHSNDEWRGQSVVQTDKDFVQFAKPEYGIRALYRVLMSYRDRHGLRTVPEIINRWAPNNENDTQAYIDGVLKKVGIPKVQANVMALNASQYRDLVKAIIYHENGQQPYSDKLINEGIALA